MSKTLDQYTLEQMNDMRGMWAESYIGELLIIDAIELVGEPEEVRVIVFAPYLGCKILNFTMDSLTPRFDLPRAWTPEGEPPEGEWVATLGQRRWASALEDMPNG